MVDWFAIAAEITQPQDTTPYVESNETFPILDEDFDQ